MNSKRTVIIAAALILAALAFFGNVYYLNGANQRAYKNAKLVQVWVVKKQIPKGLDGASARSQDYIQLGDIPQQYRPGSAIGKADIDNIKGNVALTDLSPGQILVQGQFVSPSVAQTTFAQRVPPGQVAITISVDQIHGVAGLLMPGDKVDMLTVGKKLDAPDDKNSYADVVYQNINILAIGTKAAPQAGETTATTSASASGSGDGGLITFAVPIQAAQNIALQAGGGGAATIYLALVPPDNQPITNLAELSTADANKNLPANGTPYPAA